MQKRIHKQPLIISAMEFEVRGLPFATFYTGVGKKNIRRNLSKIINLNHDFIFIGFAGALKDYKLGQVFEIDSFSLLSNNKQYRREKKPKKSIITVNRMMNNSDKLTHLQSLGFDLVDMESFYVNEFFQDNGKHIKFIKVVSDEPNYEFPKNLNHNVFKVLFVDKGSKGFWKRCSLFLKDFKILKMYLNFLKAREELHKYLIGYLS
ncbi:MAG: hypothetical protein GY817_04035 [bacterium]|nr:hypothetical protein [bacterium]